MMFHRPKIYAVYINPREAAPHETAEFIEERMTWTGFFFHVFWCAYHRLWWHAAALTACWAALLLGGEALGLSAFGIGACELFLRLVVAFEGNHWRQAELRRQGYILSDIIAGDGEIAVKLRFYQHVLDQKTV